MKLLWSKHSIIGNAIIDPEYRNLISLANDIIRAIETRMIPIWIRRFGSLSRHYAFILQAKAGQISATRAFPMLVASQLQYFLPCQINTDNKFRCLLPHNQANTDTHPISNGISFSNRLCKQKQRNASFNFKEDSFGFAAKNAVTLNFENHG